MKLIITEKTYRRLFEMAYPSSFNPEEFMRLEPFSKKIRYCKEHLQPIAYGTGRYVFSIDNDKVLKLARNIKGIAQNQQEYIMSTDYVLNSAGIIGEIFDYDEDYKWLEMEWLDSITVAQFKQKTGITFQNYKEVLFYFFYSTFRTKNSWGPSYQKPKNYDEVWENENISPFLECIGNYKDFFTYDLARIGSYGLSRKDGKIKIRDAGLTNSVFQNYYAKQPLKMDMWL
jgi:hypothetical protein